VPFSPVYEFVTHTLPMLAWYGGFVCTNALQNPKLQLRWKRLRTVAAWACVANANTPATATSIAASIMMGRADLFVRWSALRSCMGLIILSESTVTSHRG
jgi:hypothetical protein